MLHTCTSCSFPVLCLQSSSSLPVASSIIWVIYVSALQHCLPSVTWLLLDIYKPHQHLQSGFVSVLGLEFATYSPTSGSNSHVLLEETDVCSKPWVPYFLGSSSSVASLLPVPETYTVSTRSLISTLAFVPVSLC